MANPTDAVRALTLSFPSHHVLPAGIETREHQAPVLRSSSPSPALRLLLVLDVAAGFLRRNYLSDVSEGLRWNYLWNLDDSGFVLDTFRRLEERYLEAPLADMGFRRARGLLAVLD